MDLSPLQLEGYFVKRLEFSLRAGIEEAESFFAARGLQYSPSGLEKKELDPLTINFSGGGGPNVEDPKRWKFHLNIKSDLPVDNNYPYDFSLEIVGFFHVLLDDPLGKDEILIRTNATTLLYTTAREVIAAASSRGPYPGVMLPAVSFINSPLVENVEEAEKREASKKAKSSRKSSNLSEKKPAKKKVSQSRQASKSKKGGRKNARRPKKEESRSKKKK